MNAIEQKKIGFIGLGHMGQAILRGLIHSGTVQAENIYATNRSPGKLNKAATKYGIHSLTTAEDVVDHSDVVILATKPQDLLELLEPLRNAFTSDKVALSLAAGVELKTLRKYLPEAQLVRVMPNTPIFICKAVIGFCLQKPDIVLEQLVKKLFSPLGYVVSTEEGEEFSAFTVSSASGSGFIFELMQYWQDWIEEHGIESDKARAIVTETFLGTAQLAAEDTELSFQQLAEKVSSKKGVTAAGLASLRELELEGILRMSFNKALMRDHEIAKQNS